MPPELKPGILVCWTYERDFKMIALILEHISLPCAGGARSVATGIYKVYTPSLHIAKWHRDWFNIIK